MKRQEAISLGDALRQTIDASRMAARLNEAQAARCWAMVVGSGIASQSPRPTVSGGVMTVRLTSAALRQELSLHRSRIAAAINKMVGTDVLTEIRFTS